MTKKPRGFASAEPAASAERMSGSARLEQYGASRRPPIDADMQSPSARAETEVAGKNTGTPKASDPAPGAGDHIGQYEIIRELGRGGMGIIYLARDSRLGRKVAIKLLQTEHSDHTSRFIVEARATARCRHENIVVIYEVGVYKGRPFMVLEYLDGQTLSSLLAQSGPLPASRAVEIMSSVVRALACAHGQGIAHRDLKPENIIVTAAGILKVLDFGIAKVLNTDRAESDIVLKCRDSVPVSGERRESPVQSDIVGTLGYMSPEQWGIGEKLDHRTDIWAAGVILFEMLAGAHPLATLGPNPQYWVAQLDIPMPRLLEVVPTVPPELARVVDQCLRKDRDQRFPDAQSLLLALQPFLPARGSAKAVELDRKPYAGLRSFEEEDAHRFFGRDREIAAMAQRIRDYPLVAAVGPSGIGKSSFVRAGVVPVLKRSGEKWHVLVTRPGPEPLRALAALLAPLIDCGVPVVGVLGPQESLTQRLQREPGYWGSALRTYARRSHQKILVFIDQFEEVHTLGSASAERLAFNACLAAAADDVASPVRVIASIRSDFLGRIAEDPAFMSELAKGLFFLGPPNRDGLRDALVKPAEIAGYRFKSAPMVDEMLQYIEAEPGALPLLQFTAAQLWESRDAERRLLTEESYRKLGGIAGALARHADHVVTQLGPEAQGLCRSVFLQLVTAERTRAVRGLDELKAIPAKEGDIERLVEQLVDARLLVVRTGHCGATVEVVHESLTSTWPQLRRWLDESDDECTFRDRLCHAAQQWQENGRCSGWLWSADRVDELGCFYHNSPGGLAPVVHDFVAAVLRPRKPQFSRSRWSALRGSALRYLALAATVAALVLIHHQKQTAEKRALFAVRQQETAVRRLSEFEALEQKRMRQEASKREADKESVAAYVLSEQSNAILREQVRALSLAAMRPSTQRRGPGAASTVVRDSELATQRSRLGVGENATDHPDLTQEEELLRDHIFGPRGN